MCQKNTCQKVIKPKPIVSADLTILLLGEVIFFTKSEIFFSRVSRGRLYFLQNLKIFFRASRGRLYFLQNPQFFSRFARGGYIFYKISRQHRLFFERFWTVSALITAKNPKNFRALRAHDFWGPNKISALRAGGFILYKIRKKFSRASRGRFYSLQNPRILSPVGFT